MSVSDNLFSNNIIRSTITVFQLYIRLLMYPNSRQTDTVYLILYVTS